MSFAQQKQRQYSQLSTTLHKLSRELELTRNLMDQTSAQLNAMGKFAALHAAQCVSIVPLNFCLLQFASACCSANEPEGNVIKLWNAY
jgi:hypothetical protein